MESTGRCRDGGRRPSLPWSYRREQTGTGSNSYDNSISSSSSGTIVSTTYTSSGSHLSSISTDAGRHLGLALVLDDNTEFVQPINMSRSRKEMEKVSFEKEREEKMKHEDINGQFQEFFGVTSENCSISSGDVSVLESWFSELGVDWVLHLADGGGASEQLDHISATERWVRGLYGIMEIIRFTVSPFSISGSLGLPVVCEEEEPVPQSDKQDNTVLDEIHFARFTKEAMLKMFPFVDIAIRQVLVSNSGMLPEPYKNLHALLAVYNALSNAPYKLRSAFYSSSPGAVRILDETVNLFSVKQEEAGEAIWSTMEHIRNRVLESSIMDDDDSSGSLIPQASSDIHRTTLSVIEYISFLRSNCSSMCQTASKSVSLGKHLPQIRNGQPLDLDSMIMDMKTCLQEKLVKLSKSFPEQSLKFLFLLNNLAFIQQSLEDSAPFCHDNSLSEKVEGYMDNYFQACWEPVLSCLFSPTPLCFGISHSPLLKFESEFKKTYATQKLWNVPDPKLRQRLRSAITERIVPRYTEYIEENNITTPGVAPQDLENMLQELFEG